MVLPQLYSFYSQIIQLRLLLLILFLSLSFSAQADWGKNGHRTIGQIASHYLKPKAKAKIKLLLGGKSLAVVSTFADEIKSDDRYDKFKPWHYANIPFDQTYSVSEKNEEGDIVAGINKCIQVLKDQQSSTKDKVFYLKMLIHLMGDMHQPLHFGLKEDRGANLFDVDWFGEDSNLHRVWDSEMIKTYDMSYTEMARNRTLLLPAERRKYRKGNLLDWVKETRVLTQQVYDSADKGENLGYRYMYDWFDTLNLQLHKGGIRLAKILNKIFD